MLFNLKTNPKYTHTMKPFNSIDLDGMHLTVTKSTPVNGIEDELIC